MALRAWVKSRALKSDESPPPTLALQLQRHLMAEHHEIAAFRLARNKNEEATKNTRTQQKDLNLNSLVSCTLSHIVLGADV